MTEDSECKVQKLQLKIASGLWIHMTQSLVDLNSVKIVQIVSIASVKCIEFLKGLEDKKVLKYKK